MNNNNNTEIITALQELMDAFVHHDDNKRGNQAKTDIVKYNQPEVGDALNKAREVLDKAKQRLKDNTMTETDENNKLIAEFMGFEITATGVAISPNNDRYFIDSKRFAHADASHLLLYDKSWDRLIPVVAKIKNIGDINPESLTDSTEYNSVMTALLNVTIEVLYYAVVAFIKWYKAQQSLKQ